MMEKTITSGSGIVVALRNFSYVWLVLCLASMMVFWFFGSSEFELTRRTYGTIHAAILALYLSLSALEQRLGSAYLPAALGLAVLGLVIVQIISISSGFRREELEPLPVVLNVVTVMSFCAVMILIVGWKYRLAHVIMASVIYGLLFAFSIIFTAPEREENIMAGVIVISLFMSTSLGIVGYFVWRLSQAEQSQREQLAAANSQLRRQAIQREELTVSRERNRLARELHDTLAHSLSGVTVQIEAARALWPTDPDSAETMLSRADDMARTGLTEARRALQSLRATPLQDLGLGLALQAMGEEAAARAGATLRTELPPRLSTNLEPHVEQNLYRIAQEALENIVRHARAKTISLNLIETADELHLEIVDDGIGFDNSLEASSETGSETSSEASSETNSDSSDGHYGLQGMAERAVLSDASLKVVSQLGEGTTIVVRLRKDSRSAP
ncbi:MAG: sensor histidine kinase [Chloroflexota bacterium]